LGVEANDKGQKENRCFYLHFKLCYKSSCEMLELKIVDQN
jgi:hypothetical protein